MNLERLAGQRVAGMMPSRLTLVGWEWDGGSPNATGTCVAGQRLGRGLPRRLGSTHVLLRGRQSVRSTMGER